MANILTVLAFISSFLSFSIVIRTLRLSRRSSFAISFALFVLCQGIWSFSYMMIYPAVDMGTIQFWYAVGGLGWIPAHAVGLHFTLVFVGEKRVLRHVWAYVLIYMPAAILLVRHFVGDLVTAGFAVGPHGVYQFPATDTLWFWTFTAYTIASLGLRAFLLLRFAAQARDTISGRHAAVLCLADVVTVGLILMANYIIPATGSTRIPSLGAVIIIVLPLSVSYIIRRQRFLSYNLYFRFRDSESDMLSRVHQEIFNIENIFDAVENGVALVDNQHRVFRTNRVLDELTNRHDTGAPCYRALYGRNAPCRNCPLDPFEMGTRPTRDVVEIGSGRTVSRTLFPVHDEGGLTTGVMEIVRDVTSQLQTSHEHAYLLHAVENTPTQVIIADFDGTTIYVNRAFRDATGLSMEEIRGHAFWRYYEPTNGPTQIAEIRHAVVNRQPWQGEIVARDSRGMDFRGRMAIIPMVNTEPSYLLAYVLDITEEERANRMRQDVERTIRHDLKSPLTAILGMSDMLRSELRAGADRDLIEAVLDGAERMRKIIDSSSALYKMEEGTYEVHPELVDLGELVRTATRELSTLCGARRVSVVVRVDGTQTDHPVHVHGEAVHLQQMLTNLLKNAVEASPAGETVAVDIDTGRSVSIRVYNRGVVPEQVRATLFKPYVTAGKSDGSGLGLFSARLIAQAHGGSIEFTTSESAGTTFTVSMPAELHAEVEQEGRAPAPHANAKRTGG